MSLTFVSTNIHFHPNNGYDFAIQTAEHTSGAWVKAEDERFQKDLFEIAQIAKSQGRQIFIICDRYSEQDGNRRFYEGVNTIGQAGVALDDRDEKNYKTAWPLIPF